MEMEANDSQQFTALDYIKSSWNQLKYGWMITKWPSFDDVEIIHFMGYQYAKSSCKNELQVNCRSFSDFEDDFLSRLWFTYRSDFPPLLKNCSTEISITNNNEILHKKGNVPYSNSKTASNQSHSNSTKSPVTSSIPLSILTSDCGWGCMFRCGQMLLAQALLIHFSGREWRINSNNNQNSAIDYHRRIIRWFNDSWDSTSPLSIHYLLQASNHVPGEWCRPGVICNTLLKAMITGANHVTELSELGIYLARDRIIYKDEIINLAKRLPTYSQEQNDGCTDHSANYINSDDFSPQKPGQLAVLLLIPMMLGVGKHINSVYQPLLLHLFADPAFIGLIGGRPKHACYFIGNQKESLIYLDPHLIQGAVKTDSDTFPTSSWHCQIPKIMFVSKLDPSCAIGFYCRTRGDLRDLLDRLSHSVLSKVGIIEIMTRNINNNRCIEFF